MRAGPYTFNGRSSRQVTSQTLQYRVMKVKRQRGNGNPSCFTTTRPYTENLSIMMGIYSVLEATLTRGSRKTWNKIRLAQRAREWNQRPLLIIAILYFLELMMIFSLNIHEKKVTRSRRTPITWHSLHLANSLLLAQEFSYFPHKNFIMRSEQCCIYTPN